MLSKQERRAFAEIAEQITADDPGFAESMQRLQSRPVGRGHDVVAVVAAATAVLCLLLGLALPMFAAASLAYAAHRLRPRRPTRRRSLRLARRRHRGPR